MSFAGAILLIVTGLAVMGLGLLLFYAWLPFLYGFVGFDIGLLFGRWLTVTWRMIAIDSRLGRRPSARGTRPILLSPIGASCSAFQVVS